MIIQPSVAFVAIRPPDQPERVDQRRNLAHIKDESVPVAAFVYHCQNRRIKNIFVTQKLMTVTRSFYTSMFIG